MFLNYVPDKYGKTQGPITEPRGHNKQTIVSKKTYE